MGFKYMDDVQKAKAKETLRVKLFAYLFTILSSAYAAYALITVSSVQKGLTRLWEMNVLPELLEHANSSFLPGMVNLIGMICSILLVCVWALFLFLIEHKYEVGIKQKKLFPTFAYITGGESLLSILALIGTVTPSLGGMAEKDMSFILPVALCSVALAVSVGYLIYHHRQSALAPAAVSK